MGIKLGADEDIGTDDRTDARQQVAFGVFVAVGDHGAVQAEHHGIDGHGGAQLAEDLVAQALIGLAVDEASRVRPGRGSLNQFPALLNADAPADGDRRRAKRRCFRVFSRRGVERGFEGPAVDADRGEGIGLGRKRRCEDPQCRCLFYCVTPAAPLIRPDVLRSLRALSLAHDFSRMHGDPGNYAEAAPIGFGR